MTARRISEITYLVGTFYIVFILSCAPNPAVLLEDNFGSLPRVGKDRKNDSGRLKTTAG